MAGTSNPYAIVGFDPGNTCAIGILDLEGNIVLCKSYKNAGLPEVVRIISEHSTPVAFASDVSPAQEATRKLAAAFGRRVWYPEESLRTEDKRKVVEKYGNAVSDVHERDALAAAVFCMNSLLGLIARARKRHGELWQEKTAEIATGQIPNLVGGFEKGETRLPAGPGRKYPDHLRINNLKERVRALEHALETSLAGNRERERMLRELGGKLHSRPRPATIVTVSNREAVKRLSVENETFRRTLRNLEGSQVLVLRQGVPVDGVLYVKDASRLDAGRVFTQGVHTIFAERGFFRGCRNLPARQSLFGGEFLIVDAKNALQRTKEDREAWEAAWLSFLSPKDSGKKA